MCRGLRRSFQVLHRQVEEAGERPRYTLASQVAITSHRAAPPRRRRRSQMGLVFEENDTAAKGLFIKSIDRAKSDPRNAAALAELSIGDNLIRCALPSSALPTHPPALAPRAPAPTRAPRARAASTGRTAWASTSTPPSP